MAPEHEPSEHPDDHDPRTDRVDGDQGMPQETIDTPHNEPGSQAPPTEARPLDDDEG